MPPYLLHGRGHGRGMELILCHPAGRGQSRVQGHIPIQVQGVDHVRLVDVGEDVDNLWGDAKTHETGSWQAMEDAKCTESARGSGAELGRGDSGEGAAFLLCATSPMAEHRGLTLHPSSSRLTSPINCRPLAATGCPIQAWR